MTKLFEPTIESYEAWSKKSHPFVEVAEGIASRYVEIRNRYSRHNLGHKSPLYSGHYSIESAGTKQVHFVAEEDCYDHWATHNLSIPIEFFKPDNESVWFQYEEELKGEFDSINEKQEKKELENKKRQLEKLKKELGEN